jgi:hypothetical protein
MADLSFGVGMKEASIVSFLKKISSVVKPSSVSALKLEDSLQEVFVLINFFQKFGNNTVRWPLAICYVFSKIGSEVHMKLALRSNFLKNTLCKKGWKMFALLVLEILDKINEHVCQLINADFVAQNE